MLWTGCITRYPGVLLPLLSLWLVVGFALNGGHSLRCSALMVLKGPVMWGQVSAWHMFHPAESYLWVWPMFYELIQIVLLNGEGGEPGLSPHYILRASEITPGAQKTHGMLGIEPKLALCQAGSLLHCAVSSLLT